MYLIDIVINVIIMLICIAVAFGAVIILYKIDSEERRERDVTRRNSRNDVI